ncbi:MAG: PQQ-binding-like beta-propeller repeat protein [Acidobacteriota bacterium]|nr:PQQ-binding-like beta-propeller repeat protein [Acidobacteriota bacterium]
MTVTPQRTNCLPIAALAVALVAAIGCRREQSDPPTAAGGPVGAWDMTFLWEGEEDDAPILITITDEEGGLAGTATNRGQLLDTFEVSMKDGALSFSADFGDAALIEGSTFDFTGTVEGSSLEGRFLAAGVDFDIRGIGKRTRADPTPTFTETQASAGERPYQTHCAACRGADLDGLEDAPALGGNRFDQTWRGKPIEVLAFHLERMPPWTDAEPASLSNEARTDILAYLLAANGLAASDDELPGEAAELAGFVIPRPDGMQSDPDSPVVASAEQTRLLESLPAATDSVLGDPSPDDWIHWGRTAGFHNSSPLAEIDRKTVAGLKPVWRAQLGDGRANPAPLVHQGVMFLQTFPDRVLALDAASGQVLWRYQHEHDTRSTKKMGIALHGDQVLVPTSDMHLVGLHAKTGELLWKHAIAHDRSGLGLGSAPLVAGDKLVQGVMGFFVPGGPFIVAVNLDTGEEAWRFHTIARPGEPGGDSWNGLALERRSGGNVWHQGTYDADLNLVYYGPTATYDLTPLREPIDEEGVTNDALFTNTTLALNADTGELIWYFQHLRNDQWNFDWAYERQIVHLDLDGETRKVLITTGKMAITDALDAATGEYLFSIDAGVQNIVASIDPRTGVKSIKAEAIPRAGSSFLVTPNHYGARSWAPTSYDPQRQRLYLPLAEGAQLIDAEGWQDRLHPDSADGKLGRVQAIDVGTRKLAWRFETAAPIVSSVLATAGDLVFAADLNRTLRALDAETGEVLWQTELDDVPNSTVVSYAVDGKQYLAIVVGLVSDNAEDWEMAYRRFAPDADLPVNDSPKGGAAIWAFAL